MPTSLDPQRLRRQVHACWLGKAVGGTLGMPWEGFDGPNDLTFYDPVPTEMVANDDLDLQVLWACVLDEMGDDVRVDRHVLAEAWQHRVDFPWGEYGVCKRNLEMGLQPPVTGSFDNWWIEGMGAAIRSEVWACLAAGDPDLAGSYAYEDACVDHERDGIWAEQFLARLEAAAFVESDPDRLLDVALCKLPEESHVKQAILNTRKWWAASGDWRQVREQILEHYHDPDFTHVVMNLAFIVLSWLAGKGDFGDTICIATNCGQDTDCTAATVGSLLGILDPDCIPDRWLEPIGKTLVVDPKITNITPPATLDGFTDLVLDLRERLNYREPEATTPPQDTGALAYDATVGYFTLRGQHYFLGFNWMPSPFAEAPPIPDDAETVRMPRQHMPLFPEQYPDGMDLMHLTIPFTLDTPQRCKVCFSSEAETAVWLDGRYLFGRDASGRMMASPHLAPPNTYATLDLSAGKHKLVAVLKRPGAGVAPSRRGGTVTWNFDFADGKTMQWLPHALHRQGQAAAAR